MANLIYENLRGFVHSRPPLVIFMVCLAAFAVGLMTFAYLVKVIPNIPNPETQEDWNTFLESLSDMEFCVLSNSSDFVTETSTPSRDSSPPRMAATAEQPVLPAVLPAGVVNVSVSMLVEMIPTPDFVSIPHNITSLSTTLTGEQLGLSGAAAGLEMNVTFVLPMEWNHTHCQQDRGCDVVKIFTCLSFQAPASFFPTTARPDTCHSVVENGVEYHVKMVGLKGVKESHRHQILWCNSQPTLHVSYRLDSDLRLMLSLHDKSLINLHLMHTSYFLFVMVIVLFCYAIVRGRPAKVKIVHQVGEKYSQRNQNQA